MRSSEWSGGEGSAGERRTGRVVVVRATETRRQHFFLACRLPFASLDRSVLKFSFLFSRQRPDQNTRWSAGVRLRYPYFFFFSMYGCERKEDKPRMLW